MNHIMKMGMASALALATAAPAAAQYYQPTPQYQQDQGRYEEQREQYEASRDRYEQRREAYDDRRAQYEVARNDYERRRADWERARAAYDARYGYGAYVRRHPMPAWDTAYWSGYPVPAYSAPGYAYRAPGYAYAPAAPYYGTNSAYTTPTVRCGSNSTVTAGAIGAIAGALLGSNVAARNARTEGAVLGAVVGGAIGAGVGHANDRYKCDSRGVYFTQSETIPYREDVYASGYDPNRYRTWTSRRCRLAAAPVDSYGQDYRYVRVCPDSSGRYRFVG
jgi:hypothetical protein